MAPRINGCEVLDAWFAHRDCILLLATGSGAFSVILLFIFCNYYLFHVDGSFVLLFSHG
jgi:hypothetical protein